MYTLTEHALERVKERLTISPEWVLSLLGKHAVEVTCNEDSPRRHRVFWSVPDEEAFVAVVNRNTGEVITIYSARRDNLSHRILTDRDPKTGKMHTTYVKSNTIRGAMRLVGIAPAKRSMARSSDKELVARFITRDGQAKTKIIGRISNGVDVDDALSGALDKAVSLSEANGWLGLTIELRSRGSLDILQEWVVDEAISYGVGE